MPIEWNEESRELAKAQDELGIEKQEVTEADQDATGLRPRTGWMI